MQGLHISVSLQASHTQLRTNPTLLVPTKGRAGVQLQMRVHPHTARLQFTRDALCLLLVIRPDGRAETHARLVRARNHILLIAPCHEWQDRPEGFFRCDAGGISGAVDDGGFDEVAWLGGVEGLGCAVGEGDLFRGEVGQEALDFFVLHGVLDGAHEDAFLVAFADLEGLGEGDCGIAEFVVDGFVYVHALDGDADLAGVEEAERGDLVISMVLGMWEGEVPLQQ